MINENDKFEVFNNLKILLEGLKYSVKDVKDINYGLQFYIENSGIKEMIRIYQSKKGITVDLSQVKNNDVETTIKSLIGEKLAKNTKKTSKSTNDNKNSEAVLDITALNNLIGTDESGKGDYFGPLVIAGVYVNKQIADELQLLGVLDSKKLSDSKIKKLAIDIKRICKHSIVAIGNEKYNELYLKMDNLNKLLAWGHARAIENILGTVECNQVLSDQFGDEKLIQNALMKNGQNVKLIQRPRAEENIAVAAASILARFEFITRLEKLSQKYNLKLPKGASTKTKEAAKQFISIYGNEDLGKVAKLHFKTTEQVKGMLND